MPRFIMHTSFKEIWNKQQFISLIIKILQQYGVLRSFFSNMFEPQMRESSSSSLNPCTSSNPQQRLLHLQQQQTQHNYEIGACPTEHSQSFCTNSLQRAQASFQNLGQDPCQDIEFSERQKMKEQQSLGSQIQNLDNQPFEMRIIDKQQKENQCQYNHSQHHGPSSPTHVPQFRQNISRGGGGVYGGQRVKGVTNNTKSVSPYRMSQISQKDGLLVSQINNTTRKTFIIRKTTLNSGNHLNGVVLKTNAPKKQFTMNPRVATGTGFNNDYQCISAGKSGGNRQRDQKGAEINDYDQQTSQPPDEKRNPSIDSTPSFVGKNRRMSQKVAQQQLSQLQANQCKDTVKPSAFLNNLNQNKPTNFSSFYDKHKHQPYNNFHPYGDSNASPCDTNSLERQVQAVKHNIAQRKTVYGLPFHEQKRFFDNKATAAIALSKQTENDSRIRRSNALAPSVDNPSTQQKKINQFKDSQVQNQALRNRPNKSSHKVRRRVTTAINNLQPEENLEHFTQARASRWQPQKQEDFFQIKINNNEKVKNHLTTEHSENMSLMFYDFNNSSAKSQDPQSRISQTQGGDRIPSRSNYRRGRLGTAGKDKQRQKSPSKQAYQVLQKQGNALKEFSNGSNQMQPPILIMEAIREEDAAQ